MTTLVRKQLLYRALAGTAVLACLWQFAVLPWLNFRSEMVLERSQSEQALQDARSVLGREKQLRAMLAKMGPSISSDAADAENAFFT